MPAGRDFPKKKKIPGKPQPKQQSSFDSQRKKPKPKPKPVNPLLAQAQSMATAELAPYFAALEAERKRAAGQYQGDVASTSAAYKALAELQGGIAPQIQGTYQQAAGMTAAAAKGFSDAFAQASGGAAADANAFLAQQGSPQQVQGVTGDTTYAQGGFIPASTLSREGAAFSSAAAMLPSTSRGLGIEALKGLSNEYAKQRQAFTDKRLEIESGRPKLVTDAYSSLLDAKQKQQALDFNNAVKQAYLNQGQQRINQTAARDASTAVYRQNSQRIQVLNSDRSWQKHLDNLGIKEGNLRIRATELEARRRDKAKNGGYSQSARTQLRKRAGTIASKAFNGVKGKDDQGEYIEHMSYQEAIREGLAQGIPLAVMQKALNVYWNRPGRHQEWESNGEGRPYVKFQTRQRLAKKKRK